MKNQDPLLRAYCHELLPFFAKIKYAIAADLTILLNSKEHDQITKHELDQQRKQ
jgi:hypothetical protein